MKELGFMKRGGMHTSLQKIIATVVKPVCAGRSWTHPWEKTRNGNNGGNELDHCSGREEWTVEKIGRVGWRCLAKCPKHTLRCRLLLLCSPSSCGLWITTFFRAFGNGRRGPRGCRSPALLAWRILEFHWLRPSLIQGFECKWDFSCNTRRPVQSMRCW